MKERTADEYIPGGGGCTPGGSNNEGAVKCAALILLKKFNIPNFQKIYYKSIFRIRKIQQYLAVCVPDAIDSVDELAVTCTD